jgi:photosystem II stability/assembly factor-like uncharacterized protein
MSNLPNLLAPVRSSLTAYAALVAALLTQAACAPARSAIKSIPPPQPQLAAAQPALPAANPPTSEEDDEAASNRKAQEWFKKHHPDGGVRLEAVKMKRAVQSLSTSGGNWTPLGPQPVDNSNGQSSGRVWGIAIDPRNTAVIYIGTDGGGAWKTTDGGTNWQPLTDDQANINITDLEMAPSNPDEIVAVTNNGGLLKTTDAGATWTTLSGNKNALTIAISPTDPSLMLTSDLSTIYRSTDGGETWTSNPGGYAFSQIVFDPGNGNVVYGTGLNYGVYRSADSGITWQQITAGLPAGPYYSINIAIAPSSSNILYLALKDQNGSDRGFYRSNNSGARWTAISSPPGDDIPYWPWSLRVSPTNPNLVYAGSLRLSTTTDGGATWSNNDNAVHVDQHVQAFTLDGNTVYAGNDGGIFKNTAPANLPANWTSLNTTLNTVMFYPGISIQAGAPAVGFGGTQDNGTLRFSSGTTWTTVACGDGGNTLIDFAQPNNVYASCEGTGILGWFRPPATGDSLSVSLRLESTSKIPPNGSRLWSWIHRIPSGCTSEPIAFISPSIARPLGWKYRRPFPPTTVSTALALRPQILIPSTSPSTRRSGPPITYWPEQEHPGAGRSLRLFLSIK